MTGVALAVTLVFAVLGLACVVFTVGFVALVAYGSRRAGDPVPAALDPELAGPLRVVDARRRERVS